MHPSNKIWNYKDLTALREQLKGKSVVLAGGCFDVLHYGHIRFLEAAKTKADILAVPLESDAFIQKSKKRAPVHDQSQRAYLLSALHVVDIVIMLPHLFDDQQYSELVAKMKPTIIAVTQGDYHIDKKRDQARKVHAQVVVVTPLISPLSTSHIVQHESFSGSRYTL
jgi:FAD synthetase